MRQSVLFRRPDFHEPVVDGIRAIAILWVFLVHVIFFHFGTFPDRVQEIFNSPWTQWIGQGDLGVDLFFVISGYLIGTILLKELKRSDAIDMRRFYARRFLRLIPVYVVVMLFGVYFMRNIPKEAILMDFPASGNFENAWANLFYVNNFLTVSRQYMPWCWSLAIEEQFYLIVPVFLLLVVGRSRHPLRWMLLMLLVSGFLRLAVIRAYDFFPPYTDPPDTAIWSLRFDTIYSKLHMRYGGLLIGVIGAYWSLYHREAVDRFFSKPARTSCLVGASLAVFWLIATMSFGAVWFEDAPKLVGQVIHSHHRDVFAVAVLTIILGAMHGRGWVAKLVKRFLSARLFYPIAQLSYSVYLVHEIYMLWMFPKTTPWLVERFGLTADGVLWVNGLAVTVLTFGSAAVFYTYVERPCMEYRKSEVFKRLFAPRELTPVDNPA